MAYVRPAILTVGDVVSEAYMTQLRDNAIAYETHGHTSSSVDGLEFPIAQLFGDGSDGDETISSNGNLAAHKEWANLTVNTGITLDTKGYVIRVTGTLTLTGTAKIVNPGNNGANGSAGSGGGGGVGPPAQGGLAKGGRGGAGGLPATAGDGGYSAGDFQRLIPTVQQTDPGDGGGTASAGNSMGGMGKKHPRAIGGGGGKGGLGAVDSGGGGGGSGGGAVEIYARTIVGDGTIEAIGGDGGVGFDGTTEAGGGGGGGGGEVRTVTLDAFPAGVTVDLSGGTKGAGSSPGNTFDGQAGVHRKIEIGVALTP